MSQPTLIGSVQKALRLLEAVASSSTIVPAKKLARLTDLPLPTTYHLLRTLEFEGYLCKVDGGYLLGTAAVARTRPARQELLARVRPVLRSLSEELGGATYLAAFEEGEIRLVAIAEESEAQRVDLWVGVHESAHATAFGKAILAGMDPAQRDDYLSRHDLYDLTPHTITSKADLARSLPAASRSGAMQRNICWVYPAWRSRFPARICSGRLPCPCPRAERLLTPMCRACNGLHAVWGHR